jgi:futalosine hydrolase
LDARDFKIRLSHAAMTPQHASPQRSLNCKNLLLVPTSKEKQLVQRQLDTLASGWNCQIELCGLGLVQSALTTVQLIQKIEPSQVWLLGIAGAYTRGLPVGSAFEFSQVASYGIGVGSGSSFQSPSQLGWTAELGYSCPEVIQISKLHIDRLMLSVTSASADSLEAGQKLEKFPQAVAEDMETYAVALACRSMGVPLRVVRGISNMAGNRNFIQWQAEAAMTAAVELLETLLKADE